jgi:serine/threonine-protein kinase HipA
MYILKPAPMEGKNAEFMPANEHLTMQIARQVFDIETAENALIFFKNGQMAYITKRFDRQLDGSKLASEDFASLAGRTPQTHGFHFKYDGHYYELFDLMRKYLPAYVVESVKLFKLILFNYLFSNGDAHFKNFSLLETPLGDFTLSPAYDLLNSRMHVKDSDFALNEGLLPKKVIKGKIANLFNLLAEMTGINPKYKDLIMNSMLTKSDEVIKLIDASFLPDRLKRHYLQDYQKRIKNLIN